MQAEQQKKLLEIIKQTVGHEVAPQDSLQELGMDSLDLVEIAMNVEEEFDISVPDDVSEKWTTIADVIKTIDDKLSEVK